MPRTQCMFSRMDQVGEWTLLEYRDGAYERRDGRYHRTRRAAWKCQCSCGVLRWVHAHNLAGKTSLSCGHDDNCYGRHRVKNIRAVNSVFALGVQQ